MANDTLKTALPDTFNVDWLNIGGNENVLAALDSIGGDTVSTDIDTSLNAIKHLQPNFGLGESFIGMETDDEGLAIPEVSQDTMDKLTPAIGFGVGEILTRGRGLGFPE